MDFWTELKAELGKVLTEQGRSSMAVNMTGGMLQITDRPGALKRAELYLKQLERTVVRQVDIEARLFNVALNNQFQFGVDWEHAVQMYGGGLALGGAPTVTSPAGGALVKSAAGTLLFNNDRTTLS